MNSASAGTSTRAAARSFCYYHAVRLKILANANNILNTFSGEQAKIEIKCLSRFGMCSRVFLYTWGPSTEDLWLYKGLAFSVPNLTKQALNLTEFNRNT